MTQRRRLISIGAAGALAIAASGCSISRRALSSREEYELYRATRASYTVEDRLLAAGRYLDAYPEGRFAAEVRARFEAEEGAFYERRQSSVDGLDWYLHVLPRGPHALGASARRAQLSLEQRERDHEALLTAGRATERRLGRAARSRKRVVESFVGVVTSLASSDGWGRPTWAQPWPIIEALRLGPDPGRCDDLRCSRVTLSTFQIPVAGGGLDERAATTELVIDLERGGVRRLTLQGPELFSRVWEADRGRALPADKLEARAEAVGYVVELVSGAFEAVAPGARCDRGITPPVVFRRACDGWAIAVTVGDEATDDILSVEGPRP